MLHEVDGHRCCYLVQNYARHHRCNLHRIVARQAVLLDLWASWDKTRHRYNHLCLAFTLEKVRNSGSTSRKYPRQSPLGMLTQALIQLVPHMLVRFHRKWPVISRVLSQEHFVWHARGFFSHSSPRRRLTHLILNLTHALNIST